MTTVERSVTTASENLDRLERAVSRIVSSSGHRMRFERTTRNMYLLRGTWREGPIAFGYVTGGAMPIGTFLRIIGAAFECNVDLRMDEEGRLVATDRAFEGIK